PSGAAVTFTATSGGCPGTPEFEFWVGTSRGWKLVRSYSLASAWTIDYSKLPAAGTYTIDVWIRNVGSPAPYDTYALMPWVVGGCNYASTTASGIVFTTTAGGVACAAPEFKVWITGAGVAWKVTQDWSAVNSFQADATRLGLGAGTYTIDVWVRQH